MADARATPVRAARRQPSLCGTGRGSARAAVALMVLGSCDGEPVEPAPPAAAVPSGWVHTVASEPQAVLDVLESDPEGWAALHRGDLVTARSATDPHVRARAERELADTRRQLLRLLHDVGPRLAETWAGHGGLPAGTALHTWAALVAVDADQDPTPLLALGPAPLDPAWANVHGALGSDLPEEARLAVVAERAAGPIGDCLRAHVAARTTPAADLTAVDAACPQPLLREADGTRALPDPLRLGTRHALAPEPTPPSEGLTATLFSAAWSPADLSDPATGPTAALLGLGAPATPDAALQQVQALTGTLDTWRFGGSGDGTRLATDLDAYDAYRARLVTAWVQARIPDAPTAREALRAAHDTESGRTMGPTRPPTTLALEATVAIRAGHVRAALPALQALAPLAPILPELPALTELVNDLQVAATLGRAGDSREP